MFELWSISIWDTQKNNVETNQLYHNITQIHNGLLWDWQYFAKCSSHSGWMMEYSTKYCQSHITLLWIWVMLWCSTCVRYCILVSILHVGSTMIVPISVCYFSELRSAIAIWRECYVYQAKTFMFYNVWTTYYTFTSKYWTPKWDDIALHNSE